MQLNCIIVDDEPRAHNVLRHYIDKLTGLECSASCANVMEAYNYLKSNKADIIFLDINMPELDGFSLLELSDTQAAIIITTAYTDHAFKSYEYNAVDYLHKPIRFERFVTALEKAKRHLQYVPPIRQHSPIEIRTDGYTQQVTTSDILYAESMGNYIKIYCLQQSYMTLMTTRELQEKLPSDIFARIHKSYIVNLAKITGLGKESVSIGANNLPVGKTYKIYFEEQLRKYREVTGNLSIQ